MGGYKGSCSRSRTMKICAGLGFSSCLFGIPATFVKEIYTFTAMLWLMLFFGGSVLPGCTGIAVSVVPRSLRPVSSSVSLVVFNLFGYSLSLILSGSLMQIISNNVQNCDYACSLEYGFRIIVFWGVWSLVLLSLAIFFNQRERTRCRRQQGSHEGLRVEV